MDQTSREGESLVANIHARIVEDNIQQRADGFQLVQTINKRTINERKDIIPQNTKNYYGASPKRYLEYCRDKFKNERYPEKVFSDRLMCYLYCRKDRGKNIKSFEMVRFSPKKYH